MTDQSRFSMSDEAKLAAWNETVRRMKEAHARCAELEAELAATRANLADVAVSNATVRAAAARLEEIAQHAGDVTLDDTGKGILCLASELYDAADAQAAPATPEGGRSRCTHEHRSRAVPTSHCYLCGRYVCEEPSPAAAPATREGRADEGLRDVLVAVRDDAYQLGEECDEHNGKVGDFAECPACSLALRIDAALAAHPSAAPAPVRDETVPPPNHVVRSEYAGHGETYYYVERINDAIACHSEADALRKIWRIYDAEHGYPPAAAAPAEPTALREWANAEHEAQVRYFNEAQSLRAERDALVCELSAYQLGDTNEDVRGAPAGPTGERITTGALQVALTAPPGMQERVAERLGLDECTACDGKAMTHGPSECPECNGTGERPTDRRGTMVDETNPPKGWWTEQQFESCWIVHKLNGATDYAETEATALADAHRIAREEAQPYVAEALERIAKWLETDGLQDAVGNSVAGLFQAAAHEVRKMATGARPLPGGKP